MNAVPIPAREVERLAAVLGRLESNHEGEALAAASIASRRLRKLGLSWRDLAQRALAPVLVAPPQAGHRARASSLLLNRGALTAWEIDFLGGIGGRPRLTERQAATLDAIAARVEARTGGGR